MFEFEKLTIYQKAKAYYTQVQTVINHPRLTKYQRDQLGRASLSILLNLAEGSGRFTKPSKKNFYTIARGSVFECAAIMDILASSEIISPTEHQEFYSILDELSRILYSLIKKLE